MSWAEITGVETLPLISFLASPSVQVILPVNGTADSLLTITGSVPGGALPTYLRLLFYPRTSRLVAPVGGDDARGQALAGRGRSAARHAGGGATPRGRPSRSHAAAFRGHQPAAVPERTSVFEAWFPRGAAGRVRRVGAADGRHRAVRRAVATGNRAAA